MRNLNMVRLKMSHHCEAPHGEQVCHHGAEPGGEAGLGDEAELELRQADDVITLLPVPARDVQEIRLERNHLKYI